MRSLILLLVSCASSPPPCPASTLAVIEARYSKNVLSACQGYSLDTCPTINDLRAERARDEESAGCR